MTEGNVAQSKPANLSTALIVVDFPNNFPYQILGQFRLRVCLGWIWVLFSTALHRRSSISQTRQLIRVLKRYKGQATTSYRQISKYTVTNNPLPWLTSK